MNITIITAGWRLEGVRRVIECVDNQTYKKWQHIIVNDNNSELRWKLPKICRGNKNRHWVDLGVRTHYFGGFARNVGAVISFAYLKDSQREWGDEWICFLDDDNLWYPDHLETLVEGHKQKPEAVLIGVDMEIRGVINKDYRHILKCQIKPQQCDLGSFLYKKDIFEKYGGFKPRPRRKITYDWELIEKIAMFEGMDKVHIIHKPTFIYYHKER
ncbi:MAG: glycosyltransferase family A protein [Candidatus Hodarchaeales archaeon]